MNRPDDIDAAARALLAAAHRHASPDPGAAARNLAGLARRAAAGEPDPLAGQPVPFALSEPTGGPDAREQAPSPAGAPVRLTLSERTGGTPVPRALSEQTGEPAAPDGSVVELRTAVAAHRRRTFLIALAVAASALGAIRLGQGLVASATRGEARDPGAAVDHAAPSTPGGDALRREPAPPRRPQTTADAAAPAPASAIVPEPPPPAAEPPARRAPARDPVPKDSMERQLALVRDAGAALRSGDGARARQQADAYLREFPAGAFAPEAQVLRAEAICLQGQVDAARSEAARLATALAGSPLAARAEAICREN